MTGNLLRRSLVWGLTLTAACSQAPDPQATTPAADSLRADSIARAARARADSLAAAARADSLARARADSIARALEASRADSLRAEVQRNGADAAPATASGLDAASEAILLEQVYFDFDRSDVRADQRAKLDGKLTILRANPRLAIQVEGHCDERGPDEYNLALGNRRAAQVKRWLVENGIPDSRISIVSFGEERPAAEGATEDAWARNRRAEFRVTRSAR